jgi:transcriptional regulator with XRE-family HTH domain
MISSPKPSELASLTEAVDRGGADEPNAADIGARIAHFRTEMGLSLSELAALASVSKSYLSTVEKGSGSRPGATVLHKIAQALGVTLADLVGRQVAMDPSNIPAELRQFASDRNLPQRDIDMLAGIAFRGDVPKTKERWAFIYDAIKNSAAMDSGSI